MITVDTSPRAALPTSNATSGSRVLSPTTTAAIATAAITPATMPTASPNFVTRSTALHCLTRGVAVGESRRSYHPPTATATARSSRRETPRIDGLAWPVRSSQ